MASLASVLLSDIINPSLLYTTSATVAAAKTFAPEGWKPGNVASWVNRAGGIPLGYPRMTFALRSPTKESRVYKVSTKFFFPVLETIDPAVGIFGPKLAYEIQYHSDWLIHERATAAERLAALNHVRSAYMLTVSASDGDPASNTGSPLVAGVTDLEDVY